MLNEKMKEYLSEETVETLEGMSREQISEIMEAAVAVRVAADLRDMDDGLREIVVDGVQSE